MKLSLDSSRSIAAWLFKLYCFASNPTFSSRLLKYKWFYKSNNDIFFRKDGKAPNNCDRHYRYELVEFHPRLSDGYVTEKSECLGEWLDSFADYIKKLNKPVESLTGIISVNNFNSIDELVSRQEKLDKTILTKYFKRENSNYGSINEVNYEDLKTKLEDYIYGIEDIMYEWEMVSNKVKKVCSSMNCTFDGIKIGCYDILGNLRKELERKKKVFSLSFANEDPTLESESASSINDFDLGPSFNNFKEYESKYIVNYMFSFCRSFKIVKKKLNLILEILSSLNPLFISEVQDDLIRLLKLFDSNEEDTVNNLVKKVKEMNVFLYEEYKKYTDECQLEFFKLKQLTKKILPIGQNVSTRN